VEELTFIAMNGRAVGAQMTSSWHDGGLFPMRYVMSEWDKGRYPNRDLDLCG
jgi:hypothetical protein